MIIGGKCSLVKEQIIDRYNKGARYLEFHTEPTDFIDLKKNLELKSTLDEYGLVSYCIHSPFKNFLKSNCSLTSTNTTTQFENNLLIKNSIDLASKLCTHENPIVVIHPSEYFELNLNSYNENIIGDQTKVLQEELYKLDEYTKRNYPHIILGIENTLPITVKNNDVQVHIGGVLPSFANEIKSMNLSNTKLVLDICHAESTSRFMNLINRNNDLSIMSFLEAFVDNLGLIHLNNSIDLAEINKKHSTPFYVDNKSDVEYLTQIFRFLKENNYKNPITIEVLENNYLDCSNYPETLKTVNYVLKNLG